MPPRISILALKRWLKKLRIKRKPNSSKKQVIGQSSDADVDNKKDDAQSESFGGLYALIIGINSYPSLNPLKGAVSDADDMANFLMADLGISPGRIVNLRNQEATRKRIIEELQDLWKNPRISPGAPILIYYAGHGGLANANQKWKERYGAHKIQVIFPYDYGQEALGSTKPTIANCIPDKTIAQILNKLASEKGNNITVIFDSCHSDSGNRGDEKNSSPAKRDRRYRSAEVQHDLEIPVDIDDELGLTELKQHRGAELLLNTDQSSHVHFAACGARQKAIEEDGRGWFTAELLKKLREKRVDKTTYHNLLRFLSLPKEQSPQCYGKHKNRIFFDSRVPSHNVTFIRAEYNPEEASWNLEAGAASGVTLESTWELYKSPHEDSELVGTFKAKELYGSSAVLKPLTTRQLSLAAGENVLYAQFKKHGSRDELVLKVWASPGAQNHLFPGPDRHLGSTHHSGVGYRMVSTRDTADVALDIHDPEATEPDIVFYWYDVTSREYSLEKLKHRKPANREKVEAVLFATAQWRWHLQRTNPSEDQSLTVSMLKVATRISTGPRATREYLGRPESIVVENGVADLVTDSTALYGFKLQNKLNLSLYVRLFYFDATNFSIVDMFDHSAGGGKVGANVFPQSQLLIGDGADGGAPLKFDVSSNNEVELGYVKVFWSTEPLELDIEQVSAFLGEPRAVSLDSDSSDSKWGTICLPIVLRGKRSS